MDEGLDNLISTWALSSGGVWQRESAAGSSKARNSFKCTHTSDVLLEAWVLGIIAGHVVQKIAAALELDGVDSDTIKSLARLGHFGSYPNTQGVC